MNAEERQAMREKHFLYDFNKCGECFLSYPCDTIKVLDALEEVLEQVNYDIDTRPKCDHKTIVNGIEKTWWFSCPKCNEML